MANNKSRTPLGRRLVPLYERLRHPEAHLSGRRVAASNSALRQREARAKGGSAPQLQRAVAAIRGRPSAQEV